MKVVILAEKPSQAKAYAEAFQIAKREKNHIELKLLKVKLAKVLMLF